MKVKLDLILTRLSYWYLGIPFLLFCALWLNSVSAIIFSFISFFSIYLCQKIIADDAPISSLVLANKKFIYWALFIILIVTFFSGIGHYTYQNNDHLYRGALFADLVRYDWPVMYKVSGFPGHFLEGKTTMMTYYLGFYLPAAAVGKIFGLAAGRFALFLWTFIGLVLVIYQVGKYLKRFNMKLLLLFFGWGTLFFVGALYKNSFLDIYTETANSLWAGMILYADSNLGLIYWTFNQSITAWLILLLIYNNGPKQNVIFLYSLCFFLSPFAFVGLFPFILYFFWENYEGSLKNDFFKNLKPYLTFQNILGSILVLGLNFLYLSSNKAGKFFQILNHKPKILIVFLLLSWVIIAFLIAKKYLRNPLFWLIAIVLTPLPFFQQGYGIDFPGRISIPALFLLMLLVGKFLIEEKKGILKWAVLAYLGVSATWHIGFEFGKPIIWTAAENIAHKTNWDDQLLNANHPKLQNVGRILKNIEGKNILIQDHGTITNPNNNVIWNYMADIEGSRFYRWFAKKKDN